MFRNSLIAAFAVSALSLSAGNGAFAAPVGHNATGINLPFQVKNAAHEGQTVYLTPDIAKASADKPYDLASGFEMDMGDGSSMNTVSVVGANEDSRGQWHVLIRARKEVNGDMTTHGVNSSGFSHGIDTDTLYKVTASEGAAVSLKDTDGRNAGVFVMPKSA